MVLPRHASGLCLERESLQATCQLENKLEPISKRMADQLAADPRRVGSALTDAERRGHAVTLVDRGCLERGGRAQLAGQELLVGRKRVFHLVGPLPHELDAEAPDSELEQLGYERCRALGKGIEHGVAAADVDDHRMI